MFRGINGPLFCREFNMLNQDFVDDHREKYVPNKQFSQETVCSIYPFKKHRKYHVSFLLINVLSALTSSAMFESI